jgi:DNA-binding CsgD family transcriptional regulator
MRLPSSKAPLIKTEARLLCIGLQGIDTKTNMWIAY